MNDEKGNGGQSNVAESDSRGRKPVAKLLSLVVILSAFLVGAYLLTEGELYPRTDDAYVQARYITVASEVPGRIVKLLVNEGQAVQKGELLLEIDPASYELAVAEATAQVAALEAQLREAKRQRAAALELVAVSKANTERMLAQEELAKVTLERIGPLADEGFVTRERYDATLSDYEQARAGVLMARSNELAAELSVPSLDALEAELMASRVSLRQAELELERTQVKAPFDGRVVNCDLASGAMVMPGESLFALIDTSEWFVIGNYREGDLRHIRVGDRARVRVLTQPDKVLRGRVLDIGHAVQTQDAYSFGALPYVRNQLDWVRVAQRFPVRVLVEDADEETIFRVGASAVVTIER